MQTIDVDVKFVLFIWLIMLYV